MYLKSLPNLFVHFITNSGRDFTIVVGVFYGLSA